jgi:DNA-binding LacI/PurR family transcriptional regulator
MRDETRCVTTTEVAQEAGVARSTVSYVLNNHPHHRVSEETRTRVLEAAERLGYLPSAAARVLRRGRSDLVVGFLPPIQIDDVLGNVIREVGQAFARANLAFVIYPLADDKPESLLRPWQSLSPGAVVALGGLPPLVDRAMVERGVPVVELTFGSPTKTHPSVVLPNAEIAQVQVQTAIDAGRCRIGYAYPAEPPLPEWVEGRAAEVRSECARRRLPEPVVRRVGPDEPSNAQALKSWLDAEVDVVLAHDDLTAMAVLQAAWRANVAVPGRLGVIGADDLPAAALHQPPLTTIRVDFAAYADEIAARVLTALQPAEEPEMSAIYEIRSIERTPHRPRAILRSTL